MAQDPSREILDEVLRRQMPGIKTQGQYDAVIIAWDACRLLLNAVLDGNPIQAEECQTAFITSLELVRQATEFKNKLDDNPEAATSPFAETHKTPVDFGAASRKTNSEIDTQQRLLEELKLIMSVESLNLWYSETQKDRESIQNTLLRAELFDTIRRKKTSFNEY